MTHLAKNLHIVKERRYFYVLQKGTPFVLAFNGEPIKDEKGNEIPFTLASKQAYRTRHLRKAEDFAYMHGGTVKAENKVHAPNVSAIMPAHRVKHRSPKIAKFLHEVQREASRSNSRKLTKKVVR